MRRRRREKEAKALVRALLNAATPKSPRRHPHEYPKISFFVFLERHEVRGAIISFDGSAAFKNMRGTCGRAIILLGPPINCMRNLTLDTEYQMKTNYDYSNETKRKKIWQYAIAVYIRKFQSPH